MLFSLLVKVLIPEFNKNNVTGFEIHRNQNIAFNTLSWSVSLARGSILFSVELRGDTITS